MCLQLRLFYGVLQQLQVYCNTYAETKSFGTSDPKASAISTDPMLAMQWRARLTWTGLGEEISFLMFWTISFMRSELELTNTEMNK